jgi:DNA-binding Lrp family transcriptional regulator
MPGIDDTDREILRLLVEDGRRSYRDVAERVGLSPPTVSDRVDRLRDRGVVRRFTAELDRSRLVEGEAVLVDLDVEPGVVGAVLDVLADVPGVEHADGTVDSRVVFRAHMDRSELRELLSGTLDEGWIRACDVRLIAGTVRNPGASGAALAIECVVCDRPVDGNGVTVDLDERSYDVCCSSCASKLRERHDELRRAADGGRSTERRRRGSR